jgi:hypothetical protein
MACCARCPPPPRSFEVQAGPDGYRRFTSAIRSAFALPEDSELNITFTCDAPDEPATGARARVAMFARVRHTRHVWARVQLPDARARLV